MKLKNMKPSPRELYVREGDTFGAVYEVDRVAGVIRMLGSTVGTFASAEWPLQDHLPKSFVPVELIEINGRTTVSFKK